MVVAPSELEDGVTIGGILDAYLEYAQPRLKSWRNVRRAFWCYLSHLADRGAMSLSRDEVLALREHLADTISPKVANTVTELLSTVYNRAIESGVIADYNPVRGLRKYALERRQRMLEPDELPKFFKALSTLRNESIRDFFLVLLFTGEQKSRVLEMRWDDLDLNKGAWFLKQGKRRMRVLYLLPEVTKILMRRKSSSDSVFVFAGTGTSGHLTRVDKSWPTIIERARIRNLRLNDLRKTITNSEPARQAMAQHYKPLPLTVDPASPGAQTAETAQRKAVNKTAGKHPTLAIVQPGQAPGDPRSPTLRQLFESYMEGHAAKRCKSAPKMRQQFDRRLKCLADYPADKITALDIAKLHNHLGENVGQPTANSVLQLLKTIFNRSIRWGLVDRNPAAAVDPFKQQARERFLSAEELDRFTQALHCCRNRNFKAFVKVCLFTAARVSNVQSMRWQDIDWETQTWRMPITKNGKSHTVPLLPEAIAALEAQKGKHKVWVFPGQGKSEHMVNPDRSWQRLLKIAGLTDVRLHDLRRTLASWQCKTGSSLPIIGKTLGHSNPSATQIYARLDLEPVREAMQKAVSAMRGTDQHISGASDGTGSGASKPASDASKGPDTPRSSELEQLAPLIKQWCAPLIDMLVDAVAERLGHRKAE